MSKILLAAACLFAGSGLAQSTVGALALQGATKLSEQEMWRLHGSGVALFHLHIISAIITASQ